MTQPLAGRHILIVEDEYILARQLNNALTAAGATVVGPVPDVARALAILTATARIDAAILDVHLAGEKVYPVAEALQRRAVPFVFASGCDREDRDPRFAGARHLVKPLMMTTLIAAMTAMTAMAATTIGDG